jgi:hypothetical protein
LDPEIWEIRIHFDGMDNLVRCISRDDITYMNLVEMIETRGYGMGDSMYCRKNGEMQLVDSNSTIYDLLLHFDSTKKGRDGIRKKVKNAKPLAPAVPSSTSVIKYDDPVVYDFSPSVVYSVDDEGQVFSQVSSSAGGHSAYQSTPYVCTQES